MFVEMPQKRVIVRETTQSMNLFIFLSKADKSKLELRTFHSSRINFTFAEQAQVLEIARYASSGN